MIKLIDNHFEEVLLVLLFTVMSLLVSAQVFMRYVAHDSMSWSGELARYCFIWATYIGVSYGVRKKAHICVTVVTGRLSARWQHYTNIISYLIFAVFAFLVMKEGLSLVIKIYNFGQKSSSLGISMMWVYLAPPVGFALVLIRLTQEVLREVKTLKAAH